MDLLLYVGLPIAIFVASYLLLSRSLRRRYPDGKVFEPPTGARRWMATALMLAVFAAVLAALLALTDLMTGTSIALASAAAVLIGLLAARQLGGDRA